MAQLPPLQDPAWGSAFLLCTQELCFGLLEVLMAYKEPGIANSK